MLKKRIIISLTFLEGVLFRTKQFNADYRYTKEFINMWNIDELILIDISKKKFSQQFIDIVKYFFPRLVIEPFNEFLSLRQKSYFKMRFHAY
jgi:imidazole glycerol phosphate synthase subunit HisF